MKQQKKKQNTRRSDGLGRMVHLSVPLAAILRRIVERRKHERS